MSRPAAAGEIADRLAQRHVGAVLGVLDLSSGEQKILARGSSGRADGSDVTANTFFEIGSITKTFTALVLATMVESGRVRLDTPVRELLPAGATVPARDGAQITLEHLARHTSGLPRSPQSFGRDLWIALIRQANPYTMDEEAVLAALGDIRLKHRPGDGHGAYSNLGAGLLGIALRRAAGAPSYQELVSDAVLRPLGLSETAVRLAPDQEARLAQGHGMRQRPVDAWYLDGLAGAGALRSTAPDLLRYLRAQAEPDSTTLAGAIRLTHQLVGARSAPHLWIGLDAHAAADRGLVVAQRRNGRLPELRRVQYRPAPGGDGPGQRRSRSGARRLRADRRAATAPLSRPYCNLSVALV